MSMGRTERIAIAADVLRMDSTELARLLGPGQAPDAILPAAAQAVADHVIRELWTAVENGDAAEAADYAADVAERLSYVYDVRGTARPLN